MDRVPASPIDLSIGGSIEECTYTYTLYTSTPKRPLLAYPFGEAEEGAGLLLARQRPRPWRHLLCPCCCWGWGWIGLSRVTRSTVSTTKLTEEAPWNNRSEPFAFFRESSLSESSARSSSQQDQQAAGRDAAFLFAASVRLSTWAGPPPAPGPGPARTYIVVGSFFPLYFSPDPPNAPSVKSVPNALGV